MEDPRIISALFIFLKMAYYNVLINKKKSKKERIQERLETGQNPYFLKCGNILVKMSYAATERTIEDALKTILSAM